MLSGRPGLLLSISNCSSASVMTSASEAWLLLPCCCWAGVAVGGVVGGEVGGAVERWLRDGSCCTVCLTLSFICFIAKTMKNLSSPTNLLRPLCRREEVRFTVRLWVQTGFSFISTDWTPGWTGTGHPAGHPAGQRLAGDDLGRGM